MEVLIPVFALLAIVLLFVFVRQSHKAELLAEFESREFDTSAGRLRGRDLRVARYRFEQPYGRGRPPRTGWWYCVMPGPRWLLVIAQDDILGTELTLTWVVKELSEERMRHALTGDSAAQKIAFEPIQS